MALITNELRDPHADFRAQVGERVRARVRATKIGRLSAYRELVQKISDGGELTHEEIDLLEEIADDEKFNPVDDFCGDVDRLRDHQRLTAEVENFDADCARHEAEMVRLTQEMERLRNALNATEIERRQAESKLRSLSHSKIALQKLVVLNPRLFDVDVDPAPQPPTTSAPTPSKLRAARVPA